MFWIASVGSITAGTLFAMAASFCFLWPELLPGVSLIRFQQYLSSSGASRALLATWLSACAICTGYNTRKTPPEAHLSQPLRPTQASHLGLARLLLSIRIEGN